MLHLNVAILSVSINWLILWVQDITVNVAILWVRINGFIL